MHNVCVLLPVYNGESYIREAVTSILSQTFAAFDLYLIDDGSTDKTLDILKSIADERLHLIGNERNLGLIETLNKGLALAISKQYRYIVRMDADDICLPQRIEKQVAFMEMHPEVGLCGSWVEEFNDKGTIRISKRSAQHTKIASELFFQNTIWHPSVIMRTAVLAAHNIRYEAEFVHAEDYALWCRLASVTQLANLQEVLLKYRVHQSNVSVVYGESQRKTAVNINSMNLQNTLLNHPLSSLTKKQKEEMNNRFTSLLEKIAGEANSISKSEMLVFRDILQLNKQVKAYDILFFRQAMADFLLQYWSLWCKQYSLNTFTFLFIHGRFISKDWPVKRQWITAAKCIAGWRARQLNL